MKSSKFSYIFPIIIALVLAIAGMVVLLVKNNTDAAKTSHLSLGFTAYYSDTPLDGTSRTVVHGSSAVNAGSITATLTIDSNSNVTGAGTSDTETVHPNDASSGSHSNGVACTASSSRNRSYSYTYSLSVSCERGYNCTDIMKVDMSNAPMIYDTSFRDSFAGSFAVGSSTSKTGSGSSNTNILNPHCGRFYVVFGPRTCTITFDKRGGTGGTNSVTAVYGKAYPNIKIPTKEGYRFTGYYPSLTSTFRLYDENGVATQGISDKVLNSTYYAYWSEVYYYISYYGNGAEGSMPYSAIQVTKSGKLKPNVFSREGYEFVGWNTEADGTGTSYSDGQQINATAEGSLDLYAQWRLKDYYVAFNANGGSGTMSSQTIQYDVATKLRSNAFTKTGYTFSGWATTSTGSVAYTNEQSVTNIASAGSTITLYATWAANIYKIKFNGNGNTDGSMDDLTIAYDSSKNLSVNAFTRTGYRFAGWAISASGSVIYSDGQSVSNLSSTNNDIINLYAKWTPITYTIAFNANGGNGSMSSITKTYATSTTLPENTFTRKNYLFKGWSTSATGNVTHTNGQSLTTDLTSTKDSTVTLYAVWEETWANQYTVPTGSGTSAAPYLISTPKELAWLANQTSNDESVSGYFKQTADIDLTGYEWLPIGNSTYPFLGKYDGDGYVIKNLKISQISGVTRNNMGLFGKVISGELKNICLYGEINGSNYVGGIVGDVRSAKIINCTNFAKITGETEVGAMAGYSNSCEVSACINYGNVTGKNYVGGLIGEVSGSNSVIKNCYIKSEVTGSFCIGGITGIAYNGDQNNAGNKVSITGCAFDGKINGKTNAGAIYGVGKSTPVVRDCYIKADISNDATSSTNYLMFTGNGDVNDIVFEINGTKYCKGTFSNWVINSNNIPVPSGLTWLATGGTKVTSYTQITELGYTKV